MKRGHVTRAINKYARKKWGKDQRPMAVEEFAFRAGYRYAQDVGRQEGSAVADHIIGQERSIRRVRMALGALIEEISSTPQGKRVADKYRNYLT